MNCVHLMCLYLGEANHSNSIVEFVSAQSLICAQLFKAFLCLHKPISEQTLAKTTNIINKGPFQKQTIQNV